MQKFILLFLLLVFGGEAFTQTIKVLDHSTRLSIPGVTIFTPDLSRSGTTNAKGELNGSVFHTEDSLIVRHISYETIRTTYMDLQKNNFRIELHESAITLEGAGVVANRWEDENTEIPYRVEKISMREAAFQNPQTSADLIESSGYAYVQKSQMAGGSPMLRGFATNRVLLVVDGVRMNNAIFRSGNLQNVISIDANSLEETEILFGPGAVMYGSDAIGGVMDFHTLEPKTKNKSDSANLIFSGSALARFSSANLEKTGHIDFNIGLKKWAFVTAYTYSGYKDLMAGSNGNSYFLRPTYQTVMNGNDTTLINGNPKMQIHSGFSQANFLQKILFKPDSLHELEYGFYHAATSDAPRYDRLVLDENSDGKLDNAEWYYGPQKWMMHRLNFKGTKKTSIYDRIRITAAYQHFAESRHDRKTGSTELRNQNENVDAVSLNLDMDKKINSDLTFFYGMEGVHNLVFSSAQRIDKTTSETTPIETRYPDGSTWTSLAAYTNVKYKINGRWILNGGLRYSQILIDAKFDTTLFPYPFTETHNQFGALNGAVGVVFNANVKWNIFLNASTGFRAPNIDDIGKVFESEPGSVVVPNIDLKPEYAYNTEIGTRKIFANFLKVEASIYFTYLDDALARRDFAYEGNDSMMYDGTMSRIQAIQNISNAFVYGFQGGLEFAFGRGFGLRTVINYQYGREFSVDSSAYYPLSHAAPLFGKTHLTFVAKKIKLDLYTSYNSKMNFEDLSLNDRNDDLPFAKDASGKPFVPSWYTLNFKLAYFINENISLNAGIENITDQLYRPFASGISAPGRNFIVTLRGNI